MTYLGGAYRGRNAAHNNSLRKNPERAARLAAISEKCLKKDEHVVIQGLPGARKISRIDEETGSVCILDARGQEQSYDPRNVTHVKVRVK
jgi:hypothetical protein